MVNADMFKGAFVLPGKAAVAQQPEMIPNPNYVPPTKAKVAQNIAAYEDPQIAKLKFFFLKWLSIIIGGAAILLIIWRFALKFT